MKILFYLYGIYVLLIIGQATLGSHDQSDFGKRENVKQERRLKLTDLLPEDPEYYDKNLAPKVQGQPTKVDFQVSVLSFNSFNQEPMTYETDIILKQSWRDPRLQLPGNLSEDHRVIDVDWLDYLWRPDNIFKNVKKVTFQDTDHYLWLYRDKTFLYNSKLTVVLSCTMKSESYPRDTQVCVTKIQSLSHTTRDLVFKWKTTDALEISPDIELPQLDISNNVTENCIVKYSTGNFSCLSIVFTLRRRLGYHLLHTYITTTFIVVMSWTSFWIKPESLSARVTVEATSLLTLATKNTQSQQSLPQVSYVKSIDIWISLCTIFVFMSLMELTMVIGCLDSMTNFFKGHPEVKKPEGFELKKINTNNQKPITNVVTIVAAPKHVRKQASPLNRRAIALRIDEYSRVLFPLSFVILSIFYWYSFI